MRRVLVVVTLVLAVLVSPLAATNAGAAPPPAPV